MTWQPPPDDTPEPDRPEPGFGQENPPEPPAFPPPPPSQPPPEPPSSGPPQPPYQPPYPPPYPPSTPQPHPPTPGEPPAPPPAELPSPWNDPETAGQPPSDPYAQQQYGQAQYPQHGQYGQYGQQPPGYPADQAYPAPRGTNVLAIVALILSIVVLPPLGAILGHVSRRQIRASGEGGDGLALAAIIIGWTLTGLYLIGCCVLVLLAINAPNVTTG
jgi:hypothetical protein